VFKAAGARVEPSGRGNSLSHSTINCLAVWNIFIHFLYFHILGMENHPNQLTKSIIFQRGRSTTNQINDSPSITEVLWNF
jgi:hypothetical protein